MRKIEIFVFFTIAACVLLHSCVNKARANEEPETLSGVKFRKESPAQSLLGQYMPEAIADGIIKVAVVCNEPVSDQRRRFLESCASEGRSMNFTVDTFITEGDNEHCRELIQGISLADYDGLILSGGADFIRTAVKPAVDKGLKVLTFEALPEQAAEPSTALLGVTSTFPDDAALARLSLDVILSLFTGPPVPQDEPALELALPANELALPVRVIRIFSGPGIPFLDRRQRVYDEYVRQGKIVEAALISIPDLESPRRSANKALADLLRQLPEGKVDAVWAPNDEFAKGCADALYTAGRFDIKLVSIGISNEVIKFMLDRSMVWLSTVAVDPGLAGIINMRLLAVKLAEEEVPAVYAFEPELVFTGALNRTVIMGNIALIVPGWGKDEGIFDQYPWMTALKNAEGKEPRIPQYGDHAFFQEGISGQAANKRRDAIQRMTTVRRHAAASQ